MPRRLFATLAYLTLSGLATGAAGLLAGVLDGGFGLLLGVGSAARAGARCGAAQLEFLEWSSSPRTGRAVSALLAAAALRLTTALFFAFVRGGRAGRAGAPGESWSA